VLAATARCVTFGRTLDAFERPAEMMKLAGWP
jgi:hypothetical protein